MTNSLDLDALLRAAGLTHRMDAFQAHGIEPAQLEMLTDADLRELELTISERMRFRESLREAQQSGAERPAAHAERRPLTVMFVDLVGSSALGEQLDDEDMLEVIREYREFCGGIISRYGGTVVRFVGDGILAYFCYPIAHENDPERAVRAALEIIEEIGTLRPLAQAPLQARIGIATGRVIVGDLLAGGLADRQTIVGSTPNLAARLQSVVPANGIAISEVTHERVAALFQVEDLGLLDLKGFAQNQHAFRVVRQLHERARAAASAPIRLTPLFAREAELAALHDHWTKAEAGQGGAVLVLGEAGIGKSRLVERFLSVQQDRPAAALTLSGSPFHENSPLHPFLLQFRTIAARSTAGAPSVGIEELRAALRGTPQVRDQAADVIGRLLGLTAPEAESALAPEKQKQVQFEVLAEQILAWSEDGPLCILAEDLHWFDPSSRELLAALIEKAAARSALLVLTSRDTPDVRDWAAGAGVPQLRLARLDDDEAAAMVQSLFGDQPVPIEVAYRIAEKTDGIPLFIEEFVRPLLRSKELVDWSKVVFGETGSVSIPASLHEAFMARLDHSGPAKELAQVAAVIGRVVRRDVLAAVAATSAAELGNALASLQQADVLQPTQVGGQDCYAFGHSLVRDAAYDSILRERRRALHAGVARALQALDADGAVPQPELLAAHLTEAGLGEEAVPHWIEAGRRSLAGSAPLEATRLLGRGLEILRTLPPTEGNRDLRLDLVALFGPALIAVKGPGSEETRAVYNEAYELCLDLPDSDRHFPVYWGWWRVSRDHFEVKDRAEALYERASGRRDAQFLLQAHHCNWASHFTTGHLQRCCEHIEAGLAIYESGDYRDHASLYGNHDAKVCGHGSAAQAYWMLGRLDAASAEERKSLAWAYELRHLGSTIHAMDMALLHQCYRRDHVRTLRQAEELVAFAGDRGFADHHAKGLIFRGWASAMQGAVADGLEVVARGLDQQRRIGTIEDFPIYVCLLAEMLAAAGKPERALEELTTARREFDAVGLRNWLPEVWRMTGDMILAADPAAIEAARAAHDEARRIAETQGAAMLTLRIAISEAKLAERMGLPEQAHARLAAARAAITGNGSADLHLAGKLLNALEAKLGAPPPPAKRPRAKP
ncbi:ATP-binding protein [Labrys wisconsinensis]|uniref:ATPase/class 3 adenylate cyclase n=1 Tax=Labrys wisconsinensis TaxID=425677 RepID=A0ABU0J5F2_9HYPH|nr:AAA family ATPase [Labrys wisconsinensis]MDQ0469493.1 putative ATPase/class 3 adenylate cyclase [Labrys wisconsinensis]